MSFFTIITSTNIQQLRLHEENLFNYKYKEIIEKLIIKREVNEKLYPKFW